MSKLRVIKNADEAIQEKFPNPGTIVDSQERQLDENNYFANHDKEQLREKYIKFTVFMDGINQALELPPTSTVDQFIVRVNNLMTACAKL